MLRFLDDPRKILTSNGLEARKTLGQNFLVNRGVLVKILDALEPSSDDHLVEVASGLGHLSFVLAQVVRRLWAIELDRVITTVLVENMKGFSNTSVITADAAVVNYKTILMGCPSTVKCVGNLPFHRAADITFRLLETGPPFQRLILMYQKEMAKRITATPGKKEYGGLTINLSVWARTKTLFTVSQGSFHPKPDVDAAVVEFLPWTVPKLPACCRKYLRALVSKAFSGRRKTLRNALFPKKNSPANMAFADRLDCKEGDLRPEAISPEFYFDLARSICPEHSEG